MTAWINTLTDESLIRLVWFAVTYVVLIGAMVGSFLNVCIYRIPLEQSIVHPRSHCFSCGKLIPWYCNIPILAWLCLRGKCLYCKVEISPRYLMVEALTALLFLLCFLKWLNPRLLHMDPVYDLWLVPIFWIAVSSWVLGTFVDFDHFIIPDRVTLGGIVFGLIASICVPALHGETIWYLGLKASAIGLGAGFGVLFLVGWLGELVFKKEAMGFGDVKWLGAMGALLGWQAAAFILVVASFFGAFVGITLIVLRKADRSSMIPFGPYLATAALVWLFWGQQIASWYIKMTFPVNG